MEHEDAKQEFVAHFQAVKRKGRLRLLKWLLNSDFFTAPASARYHMSEPGGLCRHSVNVCKRLSALVQAEYGENYAEYVTDETIAICGLLHDVCKVDYYKEDVRNVKTEEGRWVQKPYYRVEEKLPYGHGEKSVYIVSSFIRLSRAEAMAINWHMGGFDERVSSNATRIGEAYKQFPLAVLLHIADLQATYLDENHELQALREKQEAAAKNGENNEGTAASGV